MQLPRPAYRFDLDESRIRATVGDLGAIYIHAQEDWSGGGAQDGALRGDRTSNVTPVHERDCQAIGDLMADDEASRPRRRGSMTSQTRATILEAAERLLLQDGYAAVTYRRVATSADVAAGLVQYYFPTLDELFLALLQRNTDRVVEQIALTTETHQPLRAIWKYASNKRGAKLMMEFMALANHRKLIRRELGRGGERVRQAQLQVLTQRWPDYQLDDEDVTPASLLFLMNSIPRMMLLEEAFGTRTGHEDTIGLMTRFLDRVEPLSPAKRSSRVETG